MLKTERTDSPNCLTGCGEARIFILCWWSSKMAATLEKVWQFLINLNIHLLYDSAILVLGIYPKGNKI